MQGGVVLFALREGAWVGVLVVLCHSVIFGQQRQHQKRKTRHGAGQVLLSHRPAQGGKAGPRRRGLKVYCGH